MKIFTALTFSVLILAEALLLAQNPTDLQKVYSALLESHLDYKSDLTKFRSADVQRSLTIIERIVEERTKTVEKSGLKLDQGDMKALVRSKFLEIHIYDQSDFDRELKDFCKKLSMYDIHVLNNISAKMASVLGKTEAPSKNSKPIDYNDFETRLNLLILYLVRTGPDNAPPPELSMGASIDQTARRRAQIIRVNGVFPANFNVTMDHVLQAIQIKQQEEQLRMQNERVAAEWAKLTLEEKLLQLSLAEKEQRIKDGLPPDGGYWQSVFLDYSTYKRNQLLDKQNSILAEQAMALWRQQWQLGRAADELEKFNRAVNQGLLY